MERRTLRELGLQELTVGLGINRVRAGKQVLFKDIVGPVDIAPDLDV